MSDRMLVVFRLLALLSALCFGLFLGLGLGIVWGV